MILSQDQIDKLLHESKIKELANDLIRNGKALTWVEAKEKAALKLMEYKGDST